MIPAASLILVRDAAPGPLLLMVERSPAMAFAAGALVFPGGRIDPADYALAERAGMPGEAARVAAIRECIEESAVAAGLTPPPAPAQARTLQAELLAGRDLADALGDRIALDLDALIPFARWRPGHEVSRRFDTCFFVAKAPEGDWVPNAASRECVTARWAMAAEVLAEEERGETKLIFPTRKILQRLALHGSFNAIADDARRHPVTAITPTIVAAGEERLVTIPEGLGYPVTRDSLGRADRA